MGAEKCPYQRAAKLRIMLPSCNVENCKDTLAIMVGKRRNLEERTNVLRGWSAKWCKLHHKLLYIISYWLSFVGLNRTRNFHFFSTTWVRCITTLGRACWRKIYIAIWNYFLSISTLNDTKLKEMWEICECQLRVFTVFYVISHWFVTSPRDTFKTK